LYIFISFASGQKLKWYFPKVSLVLVGSIIWSLLSAASATEPSWAVSEATKLIRGYLIFVAVMNTLKTPKDLYYLLTAILAGFAFESFLGFWQWRYGPMGLTFLGERLYREGGWRSMGTFFVPSYFGNYLLLLMPLVYRLLVFYRPTRRWETYGYAGSFCLSVIALYSSYTRGPWISLIVALGLITLFSFLKKKYRPRTKWAIALLILFGVAFGVKYSSVIMDQFGPQRRAAADIRKDQWRTALRVVADKAVWGTGLGNYELVSSRYVTRQELNDIRSWQFSEMVHNSYLLVAAETGVLGGLLFVLWFVLIFIQSWKTARLQVPYFRNIAIGLGAGFLGLAMSFYYSPDIHEYGTIFQFWLLAGIVFSLDRLELNYLKQYKLAQMKKMAQSAQQRATANNPQPREALL
jgi:O-antigen ligase